MSYHDLEPSDLPLDISPPEGVSRPLWRSLYANLQDRFAPEKLPPLALTSRPVNLGMLLGDYLGLPWYRTIFSNVGDFVLPDTQPPLQLESRPVDVGELLADEIARPWWTSLVRNLADRIAPEKLPALQLESKAFNPFVPSDALPADQLVERDRRAQDFSARRGTPGARDFAGVGTTDLAPARTAASRVRRTTWSAICGATCVTRSCGSAS